MVAQTSECPAGRRSTMVLQTRIVLARAKLAAIADADQMVAGEERLAMIPKKGTVSEKLHA